MLQIDTVCRFNQTVTTPYFKFSIAPNRSSNAVRTVDEGISFFRLHHTDEITRQYLTRLTIEPVSLRSTLINVYFRGTNRELTVDFLNSYLQTYLDKNLSKKNTIALNTINFIDNQISEISDSLYLSESKLRDYRSTHQVTDLSFQGQQALSQMQQIEEEKSTINVQDRYYNYILDYFENNDDIAGLAPPSSSNVQDPIMNSLVLELLELNAERSAILSNNTQKNLFLDQIENKINLQKKTIIENVKNNLNALNLSMNELDYREKKLSAQISNLPRTELNMVSMQRAFNLTDAIYTFMAQKRSEAAIAMASNYPDYEILEPARDVTKRIIAPKAMLNYMGSIFLALFLPTLFIILRDFFNENITNIKEVEQITGRQILTSIFKNSYKYDTVVHNAPGSSIAESFRNLRSILFFKAKKQPLKVILITSCQPQDGKSFVALNLASSIASVGHRTILVDCDLRKPTLHKKLDLENSGGLSEYLTNHSEGKDIIVNTFIDNLHFIPAGPVLPNSSELIESGALDELINYLESKYEYLIIDTTPSGMVADATLLLKYASLTLLVCRKDHTRKDTLADVLNLFTINGIENFEVIYNDIEAKESRYGQYHGYYDQKKKHKKKSRQKKQFTT
jgi:capsular exopolysaccharide synthesis family protein